MRTAEEEIAMMGDPMRWPLLILPVKRSSKGGGFPDTGVMFDDRPRVYTVNMYELGQYKETKTDDIPHIDYPDLQGVVDDGWIVD